MHGATHESEDTGDVIARLRAENAELRASLVGSCLVAPADWGLTLTEDRIFAILLKSDAVSKSSIMSALYNSNEDRPAPKLIDVFVHRLRKKTREHGVEIRTILGVGYSLADRLVWLKTLKIETQH